MNFTELNKINTTITKLNKPKIRINKICLNLR